jgi:hypothetical protein
LYVYVVTSSHHLSHTSYNIGYVHDIITMWKKFQLKNEHIVAILNSPVSFASHIAEISTTNVVHNITKLDVAATFILSFVTTTDQVQKTVSGITNNFGENDSPLWFAYPKESSKKFATEISRDHGFEALKDIGYVPVRIIAIDDDWSALRFRKPEHIKKMVRCNADTETGKEKAPTKKAKLKTSAAGDEQANKRAKKK